jgi:hypothetical protein
LRRPRHVRTQQHLRRPRRRLTTTGEAAAAAAAAYCLPMLHELNLGACSTHRWLLQMCPTTTGEAAAAAYCWPMQEEGLHGVRKATTKHVRQCCMKRSRRMHRLWLLVLQPLNAGVMLRRRASTATAVRHAFGRS